MSNRKIVLTFLVGMLLLTACSPFIPGKNEHYTGPFLPSPKANAVPVPQTPIPTPTPKPPQLVLPSGSQFCYRGSNRDRKFFVDTGHNGLTLGGNVDYQTDLEDDQRYTDAQHFVVTENDTVGTQPTIMFYIEKTAGGNVIVTGTGPNLFKGSCPPRSP